MTEEKKTSDYTIWLTQLKEAFVKNHGYTEEEAKKHVDNWNWSTYYEKDWTAKDVAEDDFIEGGKQTYTTN